TVALTSPLITTSLPITEKVDPDPIGLATGGLDGLYSSGFFENMGRCLQEGARVHRAAVDAHLEVEVWAGRAAGRTERADHVARCNLLPDVRVERGHVGVAGYEAVTVADLHHVAVP